MSKLDYSKDPSHEGTELIIRKDAPFNAEPKPSDLVKNYITPEKYFFCRNHGPLPDLSEDTHEILIQGIHCKTTEFSVKQLKENYQKHSVMMVMQVKKPINIFCETKT